MKLKPEAPTTGYVDGAWWPGSRDLSAELPALLAVLAVRLGHIHRGGQLVRLGGFNSHQTQTVDVLGLNAPCLTLLVVPPQTGRATAHRVLLRAARSGNADTIQELVTRINAP